MTNEEFRTHRARLGWTQTDCAEAIGLSVSQIRAIEQDRSRVTASIALLFTLYRFPDQPGDLADYTARGRLAAKAGWPTTDRLSP